MSPEPAVVKDVDDQALVRGLATAFPDIISYIERGEITPLVARVFPLENIVEAQREFLEKRHVGNFVLLPPVGLSNRSG